MPDQVIHPARAQDEGRDQGKIERGIRISGRPIDGNGKRAGAEIALGVRERAAARIKDVGVEDVTRVEHQGTRHPRDVPDRKLAVAVVDAPHLTKMKREGRGHHNGQRRKGEDDEHELAASLSDRRRPIHPTPCRPRRSSAIVRQYTFTAPAEPIIYDLIDDTIILCAVIRVARVSLQRDAFHTLADSLDGSRRFPALGSMRVGGERVTADDVAAHRRLFGPESRLLHAYSTTESGPVAMHVVERDQAFPDGMVPVGRPPDGVAVFLRDDSGNSPAAGAVGEIVVRSQICSPGIGRMPSAQPRRYTPVPE